MTCYKWGQKGHISPKFPNKNKNENENSNDNSENTTIETDSKQAMQSSTRTNMKSATQIMKKLKVATAVMERTIFKYQNLIFLIKWQKKNMS